MAIKVNGQEIPDEAVEYELGRLIQFYSNHMSETEIRNQLGVLKDKAVEQAIGAKLLIDDARRLNIEVPAEDVQEKLNEMMAGCGGREAFDELLRKQKLSEDVIKAGIAQGRRVDLLVEKITAGMSDPTEKEMAEHFRAHANEYAQPERASAQHILIKPASDGKADKATARARLEGIKREIEGGGNFADQAGMHSDCPSGKKTGGSLGWFSRGTMVPAFDEAVFAMEVGALSEIVESPFGVHLIHKTGQEDAKDVEFEDVRDKVRDFLRHAMRGEAISGYVEELKEKAVIERD